MSIFQIRPASKLDGNFAAAWFDNDACLWKDDRLTLAAPLIAAWVAPTLKLYRPEQGVTDVLFNPNALAVSTAVKDALASFTELEFLPVRIEGHGEFHILHVTATVDLPVDSAARKSPVSGNIVEIYGFPQSFEPAHSFFRVLHPVGSAAGDAGCASRAIYANTAGANAIEAFTSGYLMTSKVPAV